MIVLQLTHIKLEVAIYNVVLFVVYKTRQLENYPNISLTFELVILPPSLFSNRVR